MVDKYAMEFDKYAVKEWGKGAKKKQTRVFLWSASVFVFVSTFYN